MGTATRLFPWLPAAALALLFAVLACRAASLPVDDCDLWWIAAAGRDTLASGHVPAVNGYSYTAPGEAWVMHEWLFGLPFALGLSLIGPSFFTLLSLILGSLTIVLVAAPSRRGRHAASGALVLALVLVGCRAALFAPRPSHAALVFPAAMAALAFRPSWSLGRAAAAVVLELVWANAHGSFPLGIAILAAAAFAAGEIRPRLATAAAATAATLVNPHGFRLYTLVHRYFSGAEETARIIHENVVEFFPIWRGGEPFVNVFSGSVLVVVSLLALGALTRRRNVAPAVLALVLVAMAVYQVRHVTLAVVLGALLLHPEIDALFGEAGFPVDELRARAWPIIAPGLIAAIALWSVAHHQRAPDEWIADGIGGADLVELAREIPDGANVYAPFQSSGLLIWLGASRGIRVFFDSRNDCYPPAVAAAAFDFEREPPSPELSGVLERTGTAFALARAGHPAFAALSRSSWPVWKQRGKWVVFAAPSE